jgi:hypothetical protein
MTAPLPLAVGDKVISTSSSSALATVLYFPVPAPGRIKDFQICLGAALATANETFTLAYAPPGSATFTNVTSGAFTIATAASAAGNVGRVTLAPSTTAYVQDGGCLSITPSGGGSGAVPLGITIVIGN